MGRERILLSLTMSYAPMNTPTQNTKNLSKGHANGAGTQHSHVKAGPHCKVFDFAVLLLFFVRVMMIGERQRCQDDRAQAHNKQTETKKHGASLSSSLARPTPLPASPWLSPQKRDNKLRALSLSLSHHRPDV